MRLPYEPPAHPPTVDDVAVRRAVELLRSEWGQKRAKKPRAAWLKTGIRSERTRIGLVVLATVAGTGLVFRAVTPSYPSPESIAAASTRAATAAAAASTRAEVDKAKAESTQLVVPDPFAWCRCDLTPTAKSVISYDSQTNYKTLVIDRAQYVSDRAVELIMAGVPPMRIKVVGNGPSGLKVTDGGVDGAILFATPPSQSAAPATTPTSAGGS